MRSCRMVVTCLCSYTHMICLCMLTSDCFPSYSGRDLIVKAAIAGSSYSHTKYQATAQYVTGLLKPGSHGISR